MSPLYAGLCQKRAGKVDTEIIATSVGMLIQAGNAPGSDTGRRGGGGRRLPPPPGDYSVVIATFTG